MRKYTSIIILFLFVAVGAQGKKNPFEEAENAEKVTNPTAVEAIAQKGPGNPSGDDDLPIDDYIPLLVITAMGIIVYHTYRKKALDQ